MTEVDIPSDAPSPRLCILRKWPDFQGYGFSLHAEKGKAGQFIGKVDEDSPSEWAHLKEGDRIVEVQGANIGNETHTQVVGRIRACGDKGVQLLVVDKHAEEYYKNNEIPITGSMPNVITHETPVPRPGKTNGIVTEVHVNGGLEDDEKEEVKQEEEPVPEPEKVEAEVNGEVEPETSVVQESTTVVETVVVTESKAVVEESTTVEEPATVEESTTVEEPETIEESPTVVVESVPEPEPVKDEEDEKEEEVPASKEDENEEVEEQEEELPPPPEDPTPEPVVEEPPREKTPEPEPEPEPVRDEPEAPVTNGAVEETVTTTTVTSVESTPQNHVDSTDGDGLNLNMSAFEYQQMLKAKRAAKNKPGSDFRSKKDFFDKL